MTLADSTSDSVSSDCSSRTPPSGPGLVTALAVNAPFAVYCFRHVVRERWVSATG